MWACAGVKRIDLLNYPLDITHKAERVHLLFDCFVLLLFTIFHTAFIFHTSNAETERKIFPSLHKIWNNRVIFRYMYLYPAHIIMIIIKCSLFPSIECPGITTVQWRKQSLELARSVLYRMHSYLFLFFPKRFSNVTDSFKWELTRLKLIICLKVIIKQNLL